MPLATPDFETADHENHRLAFEFHRLGRVVLRRSQPADFGAVEDLVGQRGARPREIGLGEDRLGVVRRAKIIGAHIVPNFNSMRPNGVGTPQTREIAMRPRDAEVRVYEMRVPVVRLPKRRGEAQPAAGAGESTLAQLAFDLRLVEREERIVLPRVGEDMRDKSAHAADAAAIEREGF